MLAESIRPIGAALDPERVRRAAHDIERAAQEIEPPVELARAMSLVQERLDEAVSEAGDAVREAVQHLPIRRRQRRRGPQPRQIALVAVGLGAIAFAGLLAYRWRVAARARAEEARLDSEAIERAAGEGMEPAATATTVAAGTPTTEPVPVFEPGGEPAPAASDDLYVRPSVGSTLGSNN